ncbi:hypothetical protein HYY73_01310 [Candidatus Woesearchaeota archaeon]|nr:hypothetical protein [Candidatus Woesearchaeota archaeon]
MAVADASLETGEKLFSEVVKLFGHAYTKEFHVLHSHNPKNVRWMVDGTVKLTRGDGVYNPFGGVEHKSGTQFIAFTPDWKMREELVKARSSIDDFVQSGIESLGQPPVRGYPAHQSPYLFRVEVTYILPKPGHFFLRAGYATWAPIPPYTRVEETRYDVFKEIKIDSANTLVEWPDDPHVAISIVPPINNGKGELLAVGVNALLRVSPSVLAKELSGISRIIFEPEASDSLPNAIGAYIQEYLVPTLNNLPSLVKSQFTHTQLSQGASA